MLFWWSDGDQNDFTPDSPINAAQESMAPECLARVAGAGIQAIISNALPFGRLGYAEPNAVANAIGYAKRSSRSHDAVIRGYDAADNVIETHEHKGDFKE